MNKLIFVFFGLAFLGLIVFFSFRLNPGTLSLPRPKPKSTPLKISDLKVDFSTDSTMQLSSSAFNNQHPIPEQYTCSGDNVNPPLQISDVPPEAQSLTLIVDDPDATNGTWDHWLVYNIYPQVTEIAENSVPLDGVQLTNSFKQTRYGGPCPPPGSNHRYYFKLTALDTVLDESKTSTREDLLQAIKAHGLASARLIGTFSRE